MLMSKTARVLAVSLLALAQACVIQPYNGEIVGKYSTFTVAGYTDQANASVRVEAFNFVTSGWETIGTTTAGASPQYAAGHWSSDSPALYYYSVTVRVADQAIPATDQRWTGWPDGSAKLRIRNTSKNTTLYSGDYQSLSCFLTTIEPTADFEATAYDCGYDSTELWVGYIG